MQKVAKNSGSQNVQSIIERFHCIRLQAGSKMLRRKQKPQAFIQGNMVYCGVDIGLASPSLNFGNYISRHELCTF